jgi:hypothetical protein
VHFTCAAQGKDCMLFVACYQVITAYLGWLCHNSHGDGVFSKRKDLLIARFQQCPQMYVRQTLFQLKHKWTVRHVSQCTTVMHVVCLTGFSDNIPGFADWSPSFLTSAGPVVIWRSLFVLHVLHTVTSKLVPNHCFSQPVNDLFGRNYFHFDFHNCKITIVLHSLLHVLCLGWPIFVNWQTGKLLFCHVLDMFFFTLCTWVHCLCAYDNNPLQFSTSATPSRLNTTWRRNGTKKWLQLADFCTVAAALASALTTDMDKRLGQCHWPGTHLEPGCNLSDTSVDLEPLSALSVRCHTA